MLCPTHTPRASSGDNSSSLGARPAEKGPIFESSRGYEQGEGLGRRPGEQPRRSLAWEPLLKGVGMMDLNISRTFSTVREVLGRRSRRVKEEREKGSSKIKRGTPEDIKRSTEGISK